MEDIRSIQKKENSLGSVLKRQYKMLETKASEYEKLRTICKEMLDQHENDYQSLSVDHYEYGDAPVDQDKVSVFYEKIDRLFWIFMFGFGVLLAVIAYPGLPEKYLSSGIAAVFPVMPTGRSFCVPLRCAFFSGFCGLFSGRKYTSGLPRLTGYRPDHHLGRCRRFPGCSDCGTFYNTIKITPGGFKMHQPKYMVKLYAFIFCVWAAVSLLWDCCHMPA